MLFLKNSQYHPNSSFCKYILSVGKNNYSVVILVKRHRFLTPQKYSPNRDNILTVIKIKYNK